MQKGKQYPYLVGSLDLNGMTYRFCPVLRGRKRCGNYIASPCLNYLSNRGLPVTPFSVKRGTNFFHTVISKPLTDLFAECHQNSRFISSAYTCSDQEKQKVTRKLTYPSHHATCGLRISLQPLNYMYMYKITTCTWRF